MMRGTASEEDCGGFNLNTEPRAGSIISQWLLNKYSGGTVREVSPTNMGRYVRMGRRVTKTYVFTLIHFFMMIWHRVRRLWKRVVY